MGFGWETLAHDGLVNTESSCDPLGVQDANQRLSPIEELQRWQDFGATWRVLSRSSSAVTIALYRCDSGEEIQRLISTDPDLRAWLAGRTSSEQ